MTPNAQDEFDRLSDEPSADELLVKRLKRAERNEERTFTYGIITFTNYSNWVFPDWRMTITRKETNRP